MKYIIREYKDYNAKEILPLYENVGWTNYTTNPDMLENSYLHSLKIYGAYTDEKLIGVIRVVGDGYSVIFIQDIIVQTEFQHQGIGTALMHRVLTEYENVYQIHLMTDNTEKTNRFYKSVGFQNCEEMNCRAFSKYHINS